MNQAINYTIIIPHKDIPELLERCIASIPQRDDVQIIVADDHSDWTNKQPFDFPSLQRKDVELIFTHEGKGGGYARNQGLKAAKGKWILFADADDFFTENVNEILEQYKDSASDLIFFKSCSVDSDTLQASMRHAYFNGVLDRGSDYFRYFYYVPWGKIIRHDLIQSHAIRFDETPVGNDVMFSMQTGYYAQKIEKSDTVLYCITARAGSCDGNQSLEAMFCRYEVAVRRNFFLKEHQAGYACTAILPLIIQLTKKGGISLLMKVLRTAREYNISIFITNNGNFFRTLRLLLLQKMSGK
ncbi:hypothetical protein FACS189413_08830 [Bacteroidia bacterium]|nr:hypothetical protein FACS189463_2920 [Bacteroidia bacterium]GHU69624.1 hypothetical protein FACS189413_08830 [Bacteroidia bacterium]